MSFQHVPGEEQPRHSPYSEQAYSNQDTSFFWAPQTRCGSGWHAHLRLKHRSCWGPSGCWLRLFISKFQVPVRRLPWKPATLLAPSRSAWAASPSWLWPHLASLMYRSRDCYQNIYGIPP